jgi:hypothetical protein
MRKIFSKIRIAFQVRLHTSGLSSHYLLCVCIFYLGNRQFIIYIEALQKVKPVENAQLIIKLNEPNHKLEIDMSRLKSPEFKKWMDK